MSGRAPITCKFGVQCHRQDCWYSHPDGRIIDAMGGSGNIMGGRGGGGRRGGGDSMRSANGMMAGGPPQPSPRMSGGGGGRNECRYAYDCNRKDCHFSHPYGRAIDNNGSGGGGVGAGAGAGGGPRPALHRPTSSSSLASMGSLSRGMSELSFGSYPPANATDDEQDLKDTWFPKARECTCCKGYVYGCTSAICESMGQCTCSIEESDLKGGDSYSSAGSGRDEWSPPVYATGPLSNGGGKQPPRPPTEAALAAAAFSHQPGPPAFGSVTAAAPAAAAAGADGRRGGSAMRSAGGVECRYGVRCTRAKCAFMHSEGRHMDRGTVTFGDFGPGGAGDGRSGSGVGGGKPVIDQDLMDTWYPDCRECTCCKGYKHGCKTPSCAAAGLCACSSQDGTVSPVTAASSPPVPQNASNATPAPGDDKQASPGKKGASDGGGGGDGEAVVSGAETAAAVAVATSTS